MRDNRIQLRHPVQPRRGTRETGLTGRVFAKRDFELWHAGTVEYEDASGVLVVFDNMDEAKVDRASVCVIDLRVGDVVFVQRQQQYLGGQPAEITKVLREAVEVRYLNPLHQLKDLFVEFVRDIRCYAQPVDIIWHKGDRVSAYWSTSGEPPLILFFPAVVQDFHYQTCVEVDFDDGNQTVLPTTLLQPLEVHAGDYVYVRNDNHIFASPYAKGQVLECTEYELVVRDDKDGGISPVHISRVGMVPRGYQMLEGKLVKT